MAAWPMQKKKILTVQFCYVNQSIHILVYNHKKGRKSTYLLQAHPAVTHPL